MGHYYQPPPPIISATGAQPYAGNKLPPAVTDVPVNNPPFSWQMIPTWAPRGILPTLNKKLSPSISSVKIDSPPPNHDFASTAEEVIDQWQIHTFDPQPFFGGRQPWQNRNLPPSLIAVAVNNPPFIPYGNDTWPVTIQQAWIPPNPLPTLRPDLTPSIAAVPVNNPPFVLYGDNSWLLSTVQAWIPPDPPPTLPGKLSPGVPGQSVDPPPFVSEEIDQAQAEIIRLWQPSDPQPQQPGKLSPGIPGQSVDFPPFVSEELDQAQAQIIRAWQSFDPQPQQPGKPSPGIPGQSVDNPPQLVRQPLPVQLDIPYQQVTVKQVQPFVAVSVQQVFASIWLNPVLASWQVTDPQPTLPNKLNPSITAVQVDNPPFAWQMIPTWEARRLLPQTTKFFVPPSAAVSTQVPFTQAWLSTVTQSWQPADPQPSLPRNLPPQVTAVRVDNPPGIFRFQLSVDQSYPQPQQSIHLPQAFVAATVQGSFTQAWLASVVQSWQPLDYLPTLPNNLNPSITAVQVDNPPFGLLITVIEPWVTDQPAQQKRNVFTTSIQIDNPPFSHPGRGVTLAQIVVSWLPPDPQPKQAGPFFTTGVSSDNPPFSYVGRGAITAELIRAWDPPDPQPLQKGPLSPALTAVQVNNPPFSHFGRAGLTVNEVLAWIPPDPPPVQKGPLPPSITAVQVDNPPGINLANTETTWAVVGTWEIPLPPQPQQTRYIVHIIPPPVGKTWYSYISSSYIQ